MALSKVIYVQDMKSFIQNGMTYDQISTIVTVFQNFYTHLSNKIASLYKVRENQNRKMVHGIMKGKGINVGETKIGAIFGEINLKPKQKGRNFPAAC